MYTYAIDSMLHQAKAVANRFLAIAGGFQQPLTPMKLQKLVYYAHGWNLGIFGVPLINEQIEAWKFGPVIPSVYHEFKHFGHSPITDLAERLDYRIGDIVPFSMQDAQAPTTHRDLAVIDRVWKIYNRFTSIQLSNMTHETGSPWETVWSKFDGNPPKGTDIPSELIRSYFTRLAHAPQTIG